MNIQVGGKKKRNASVSIRLYQQPVTDLLLAPNFSRNDLDDEKHRCG